MSYETEEQQIERLKEWWRENGTPLIVGAVLGLAGFGGWKYWNEQKAAYQASASDAYIKVTEILKTDKKEGLKASAESVKTNYPESSYAILSAFQLAKLAAEAGELESAVAELTWVVDTHPTNELTQVAKIRLARLLIEQDKASEALPLLKTEEGSGYEAIASLVKGDALVALDRKSEALAAYKVASGDMNIVSRNPTLQIKIDQLSASDETVSAQVEEVK